MSEEKAEIATKFLEIVNTGLDKFEQNATLKLFRSIFAIKCKLNPLWMIEIIGPFFYTYRESIAKRDLDYFINMDWHEQRADWVQLTHGYGESVALVLEAHIKDTLKKLRKSDPKALEVIPVQLLKIYIKYVQSCRSE
jgi:hypothetical protein